MLSNYQNQSEIFVFYPITPIKTAFQNSLYHHLLDNVWGERREVEEDIRVGDYSNGEPKVLDVVRYQFGNTQQAEDYCDEIAHLIEKHIEEWAAFNGGYEIVGA